MNQLTWIKNNKVIRYIFFGGLTTLVNLAVYYILRMVFHVEMTAANIISVSAAILFAYFTNAAYVFESEAAGFSGRFKEFLRFVSARLSTMAIEVGGVWFMARVLHLDDRNGKLIIQFVTIVLNYLFSRFLVFTAKGS